MAVALLVGVVGILGYNNTKTVDDIFELVEEQTITTIDSLKDIKSSSLRVISSTMEFALIKSEKAKLKEKEKELKEAINKGTEIKKG